VSCDTRRGEKGETSCPLPAARPQRKPRTP
jgi:hypothetical protein